MSSWVSRQIPFQNKTTMAKEKTQKRIKAEGKEVVTPAPTRGRVFEGTVTKKFPRRVVVEAERTVYHHKFERFFKKKTRLHARIPDNFEVNVGDYIKVRESRPLSKIISFVVIGIIRKAETVEAKK